MCGYVGFPRMYVEFYYWINIWGLGGYMRTAPDIFIGWYICYFIRPAWQQVVWGRHSDFKNRSLIEFDLLLLYCFVCTTV